MLIWPIWGWLPWGRCIPFFCWGCAISMDNSWCITDGQRMHNRCCACAYQLLCKRTTAVVRPKIQTVSTTYPISINNRYYLYQQQIQSLSITWPISFNNMTYIYQQQERVCHKHDTPSSDYSYWCWMKGRIRTLNLLLPDNGRCPWFQYEF